MSTSTTSPTYENWENILPTKFVDSEEVVSIDYEVVAM